MTPDAIHQQPSQLQLMTICGRPVVVAGLTAKVVAEGLLVLGAVLDTSTCYDGASYPSPTAEDIFMAFCMVMFAYGGHAAFPTIQHDMRKPFRFHRAVIVASGG
uniref:Aa_trans domain-containing protein n=1 Tax=Ascaris lumbricoides TaxID=6252 RepID=A0A0M3I3C0_ASCLU